MTKTIEEIEIWNQEIEIQKKEKDLKRIDADVSQKKSDSEDKQLDFEIFESQSLIAIEKRRSQLESDRAIMLQSIQSLADDKAKRVLFIGKLKADLMDMKKKIKGKKDKN